MTPPAGCPSLRTQLLVELGFFTSAAVLVVGVTTAVVLDGDLRVAAMPLVALWGGSTLVFVVFGAYLVRRLVLGPLQQLAADADALADGNRVAPAHRYESAELEYLAGRYRRTASELLDVQSHVMRVEKLAGVGQLAAGIAHEIRNPLGALGTYVEILRRRGDGSDVTDDMRHAIERIERTVQGLLDYAKPGDGIVSCDLNAAVRTSVDFLASQGALRNRELALALTPDLPVVRGARHALEQVVLNLTLNALQASEGGRVTVGTKVRPYERRHDAGPREHEDGGLAVAARRANRSRPRRVDLVPGTPGAMLYVADEGPGVPSEYRDRIFDPFFTTKDPGEGTGLGLAIVERTVHDAGGVVWVDPARERGAVFKVFLPLAGQSPCEC